MTEDLTSRIGCKSYNLHAYCTLILLASGEKQNITQLSKIRHYSIAWTGKMVRSLEKKGFVKRIFSGHSVYIKLTDSGKKLFNEILEGV